MKLVVANPLSDDRIAALKEAVPGASVICCKSISESLPLVPDADAIAMWGFQNVEPLLKAAPHVRWVHSLSDGVEKLLTPSMMARPIILTNSHGVHDRSVSEHTMALMLSFLRRIPDAVRNQDAHSWKRPRSITLADKTIAIIGFGSIGRAIAKRAKAFDTRIIAVKKHITSELFADEVVDTDHTPDALAKADIVIAALPATPDTEKFFGEKEFAAMKEGALFINIARANIVDEDALLAALDSGHLAGACLDVFSKEPLPADHPFWDRKQIIMTPHIASMVPDFWDRLLLLLKDNFTAFSKNEPLLNVVDKEKGY